MSVTATHVNKSINILVIVVKQLLLVIGDVFKFISKLVDIKLMILTAKYLLFIHGCEAGEICMISNKYLFKYEISDNNITKKFDMVEMPKDIC